MPHRQPPVPFVCVPPCEWITTAQALQLSTDGANPAPGWASKVLRIRGPRQRRGEAGFFVYVLWALNAIEFALRNGLEYCVFLDGTNVPYWSDSRHTTGTGFSNMWEDFFVLPVHNRSRKCDGLAEARALELTEGHFSGRRFRQLEAAGWALYLQASALKAFPAGDCPVESMGCGSYEWYTRMRARGAALVQQHLRVRPEISRIADEFWEASGLGSGGRRVLSAHCRGTDKIWGTKVGPDRYFPLFRRWLRAHGQKGVVFVATDDPNWLRQIGGWAASHFPGRVVWRNVTRSKANAFLDGAAGDPYVKAVDVLVDALLLSKGEFLLKSTTNVAEMAIYLSPEGRLARRSYDFEIRDHPPIATLEGFPP